MSRRTSKSGWAHAKRVNALLDTPVLQFCDVPLVSFAVGQPKEWAWPTLGEKPAAEWPGTDSARHGYVYFARLGDGLIKIGFSAQPVDRLIALGVQPLLFIAPAQLTHERALHRFFAAEQAGAELFTGQRLGAFLDVAHARCFSRLRAWELRGYRVGRAALYREKGAA